MIDLVPVLAAVVIVGSFIGEKVVVILRALTD